MMMAELDDVRHVPRPRSAKRPALACLATISIQLELVKKLQLLLLHDWVVPPACNLKRLATHQPSFTFAALEKLFLAPICPLRVFE